MHGKHLDGPLKCSIYWNFYLFLKNKPKLKTRFHYQFPVGTRRHYDVVLPSHKGRDVVQLKYNFKVTSLLWRLSDCYDTTSVWRCVMVGYGRDLFPTISYLILTSPTQRLNDLF